MNDIFISYSKFDKEYVELIKPILKRLNLEIGISFFQDVEDIDKGDLWERKIKTELVNSSIILCFVSNHYFSSEFITQHEINYMESHYSDKIKILCIMVEPVNIESNTVFSKVQWINNQENTINNMSKADISKFVVDIEKILRKIIKERMPANVHTNDVGARYNVVVAGKAGVGKSELINYLVGYDVFETGIGKPVTKMGFHKTYLNIKEMPVSIWDSGGLEVGNSKEWLDTLETELTNRGPMTPVETWFHTVLYCVQVPGSRIESFEIDVINRFLKRNYKVIVVMTKCYVDEEEINQLIHSIQSSVQKPVSFVKINSKIQKLRSGEISKYGIEGLKRVITFTLIQSLTERIPTRCIAFMEKYLDNECTKLKSYVEEKIGYDSKNKIAEHICMVFRNLVNDINYKDGAFYKIVLRETRYTLQVYQEILGIVERGMNTIEEGKPINNVSLDIKVAKIDSFWSIVDRAIDNILDYDISDTVGETVDKVTKVLVSPFAVFGGLLKGLVSFIEKHSEWQEQIYSEIDDFCSKLKKKLWNSEDKIRKIFIEKHIEDFMD
jgi:GTP-binding protein EngB required for normal cell division